MYEENKKVNIKVKILQIAIIKKFRIKSFKSVNSIVEFKIYLYHTEID